MQITRPSQFGSRSGITIIEVLTAMVVAMIGVFGIMVLIPFAIKQAETGLDYDDANRVARNAVEQFEIGGHDRLIGGLPTWFAPDDMDNVVRVGSLPIPGPPDSVPPGIDVYVIDPLSIGFHANPGFNGFGQFPPASSFDPAFNSNYPRQGRYMPVVNNEFPYLPEANLGTYDSRINPDPVAPDPATPRLIPMEFAESVRMFRATDDLEFGTFDDFTIADMATYAPGVPDKKLLPPRMYFDSAAGVELRRQARGEMSWQMILVPVKDDYVSTTFPADSSSGSRWYTRNGAWKFRQFTLVYSNRVLDKSQMVMPIAEVLAAGPLVPPSGVRQNGGTITVDKPVEDVRKDDWIMMINQNDAAEPGYEKQIGFYRVVDTNGVDRISLDGPDFNFGPGAGPDQRTTYVVHLVNYNASDFAAGRATRLGNVVNVYERTFQIKGESTWAN